MTYYDAKFWNGGKYHPLAREIEMNVCWYYPEPHEDMYWNRPMERVTIGGSRSRGWRQS